MTLLYAVRSNSSAEDYSADCDYVVVEFTKELLQNLAAWKAWFDETKKRFPDARSLKITSFSATFISGSAMEILAPDNHEDIGYGEDPVLVTQKVEDDKTDTTVSEEIWVNDFGFGWKAYPKHADIVCDSESFSWEWLDLCIHCGGKRDTHVDGKCLFTSTTYRGLFDVASSGP